ncbi:MAG: helix-turn-helix domain-containing protein [Bacteroidota bacterium]|jgi:transcriptional regulator with XRE-family HTH domain
MIIKQIRKSRGLTTTQVAKHLEITQGFYSQLENGRRAFSKEQLSRLSDILHLPEQTLRTAALSVAEDASVSNHWISNLPLDGIPLKAWLLQTDKFVAGGKTDFRMSLIRIIKKSIEKELSVEFDSNPQLLSYLFQKAKSPKPQHLK